MPEESRERPDRAVLANNEKWFFSGATLNTLDRIKIMLVSILGHWIIYILCRTLRWEYVNRQTLVPIHDSGKRLIMAFWHGRIFMATYFFRNRGIVVMTSQNRDGEYIAGVIRRFGYGVARGSSTRGSHSAASEALRALRDGKDVGITMDGPRGPRYVAKRGAAFLARKTGNPVLPFHIAVEKKWVMKSWDHFQIPKPFSRAIVLMGEPIFVDPGSDREDIEAAEAHIQKSLGELLERGDRWWNGEPDR